MSESLMGRMCHGYIRRIRLIGALYSIVPAAIFFTGMFVVLPFRSVYVLRFVLSLIAGGVLGAVTNQIGLNLWLGKHRSGDGPATVIDGIWVGMGCGLGPALVPPLTSLIGTNHLEEAKWFIICAWAAAMIIGGSNGAILSAIARKHVERNGQDEGGTDS